MWKKYFRVVKILPGRVVTPGHGELDFSRDDLPVEIVQQLYEEDFQYLEITEEGKKELYGIDKTPAFDIPSTRDCSGGDAPIEEAPGGELVEPKNELSETVGPKDSPPNRKKYAKRKGSE